MSEEETVTYTYREYLILKAFEMGAQSLFVAIEAVSSFALANPEKDMDEERSWDDWEDQ